MPKGFAQLFGVLTFLLLPVASGQHESGVPVEVVSSSQYGNGSCGLVFCNGGVSYELRATDVLYFLSCKRDTVWGKCPILTAGEKFRLTIDAKNHVYLTGSRGGKPVNVQLEYEKSERLASSSTAVSRNYHTEVETEPEPGPISESGKAFLAHCDSDDGIEQASCKIWVDGYMNGLETGMAAATPGEAKFDPEKNDIICLTKSTTSGQVFSLILKYVRDHPTERGDPTAALAFAALV